MPGKWKIGGCSIASIYISPRAARTPSATTLIGITLMPATIASGWAWPLTSASVTAPASATHLSAAPSVHSERCVDAASTAAVTREASQRKLPTAIPAPAAAPSAPSRPPSHAAGAVSTTPSTHASRDTRAVKSLGVIELPFRLIDRPKENHESRGDAEAEPDQQQPGLRAEPLIQVITAGQADHGGKHHREADRGQLGERGPGRFLPGLRHAKRNTNTASGACEAGVQPRRPMWGPRRVVAKDHPMLRAYDGRRRRAKRGRWYR